MSYTEQEMQRAVAQRDNRADGHFYYAVTTTGIYCNPSCPSRHAKPENMRFYADVSAALSAGYRPCKRCTGAAFAQADPRLVEVARTIEAHFDDKLTLSSLAQQVGLSSSRLQRLFSETYGISAKGYQDALRMRKFKGSLKAGASVTEAIFSSGFGSISRLYGEASRNIGMAPKAYRTGGKGEKIYYLCRQSALGLTMMAATQKGVCFVEFGECEDALLSQLANEFSQAELIASKAEGEQLESWLQALALHLEGEQRPDFPLDIRGTAFQVKVWQFLLGVREGEVLSYAELAQRIGKPKAVRAVASACGKNRIGVLIPCHRVLRADGSLGGYRWGLERKRALLDRERKAS
ncbi:MAG: bifunctional DNA-binding transcriptional regulator/O6-methylguanine-DNA methyltransferase Ada [Pseudomonadales bacterium]